MAEVEAVTEGRVKIVMRAAAVGTAPDQFDVVRDGLADISLIVPSYRPGRFPLLELGEMPLLSTNTAILAPGFYRQYEQHLAEHEPFAGTQVLSIWSFSSSTILTRNRPIEAVTDFAGLKLYIAQAAVGRGLESLGVIPVQKSIQETYSMSSSGLIDAVMMPFDPSVTWKLQEFYRHFTVIPGGLGQSVMALLVNEDKWASISEQDRAAIMAISGEKLAADMGVVLYQAELSAAELLRNEGVTISDLPETVFPAIEVAFEPVDAAWVAKAQEAGLSDAREVLDNFRAEVKALENR
jgi:TRAP-type C4-dicarboxylate transport system substrate-binding protein